MPPSPTSAATSSPNSEPTTTTDLAAAPFDRRVEQTVRWLLTGARDADVLEAIKATWPEQDVQPLIVAAVEQLAASGTFDKTVVRGWCFEATKDLYRRMVEIGDFAGAIRAVKLMRELAI